RVVHPRLSRGRLEREVGRPACGALHVHRLRSAHDARSLPRRAALRGSAARLSARVRLGGVSVHAVRLELEYERCAHAVLPRLGLLARLETGGPWRLRGALGLDEVRFAARRPALAHVPGAAAELALRARLRGRDARGLLDPPPRAGPVPRGARLLDADGRLPDRARSTVVALGLAAVPRARPARPAPRAALPARPAPRRGRRARLLPAPQVPAAARRAHGGAPRRLRARGDVLALHVHPVVLSLRRGRPPRAGRAAPAAGRPGARGAEGAARRRALRGPGDRSPAADVLGRVDRSPARA